MKKSNLIIYSVAVILIIGLAIFLWKGYYSNSITPANSPTSIADVTNSPQASLSPSPTPTPTTSPIGATYSNTSLGITFQYPQGYYVIEEPANSRLEIQNESQQLTGIPDSTYRDIELEYGANALDEAGAKSQPGVQENVIAAQGATIHLYTYPNPNTSSFTIAEAFWSGKTPFSLSILWDRTSTSQAEGSQEADEVSLMKEILPTMVVSK